MARLTSLCLNLASKHANTAQQAKVVCDVLVTNFHVYVVCFVCVLLFVVQVCCERQLLHCTCCEK